MRHSKWILALLATLLALVPAFLLGAETKAEGQVVGVQGDICPVSPEGIAGVTPVSPASFPSRSPSSVTRG
jgi:hypothetical protein